MKRTTEDALVQQTTADFLLNDLGWDESIFAQTEVFGKEGTLGRESDKDVVLTRYLGQKLIELNPGLPDSAYRDALQEVVSVSSSTSMLAANQDKDRLHKEGVSVRFQDENGQRVQRRLRLFDFDNPDNNHFLVVREFWVRGSLYRRRADIVGFVNGLPLVFMELKNVHKELRAAYDENLSDYKDTVPHLFHHNAFIVLGNGIEAKMGSLTSRFEHFNNWKRLHEEEPGVVDMATLLKGTCGKANLMDVFENFILFDDSSGDLIKIVARNHQYLGVNEAVQAVTERKQREGRLGVFWHTQGSGKSYSIVFFSRKVHRKLGGNFTFLVVTDRDDLDTQIYTTFAGCGLVNHDKDPCQAQSGDDLQLLLGQQKNYVFTLVQKFNKKVTEPYSRRDDIIVITDEAHRTQYGTLSLNMRDALPGASFIGFTGTPLFKEDKITERVFGDYISTYDFQRAVEDGATVPLYYDARGEDLLFKDDDGTQHTVASPKGLNEKIAEKLEELDIDDVNVAQRLERALKRDYHIITATSRLDQIARDFVRHYANGWENGKAMMVCIDKVTCVRMHKLMVFYWQEHIREKEADLVNAKDQQDEIWRKRQIEWMKETLMAVVVSEEQGEVQKFKEWELDIIPHRKRMKEGFVLDDGQRLNMEDAFKKKDHPFRVAIVCAMWLTGFDVPTLSTLYLDKPLKAHTLMQAIARANRVAEGKSNGLIVDYCGILKSLRKALSTFAGRKDKGRDDDSDSGGDSDTDGIDPNHPDTELLDKLKEAITLVRNFLRQQGFEFDDLLTKTGFELNAAIDEAKEAVNENDKTRKQFEIMAREVLKLFRACINVKGVQQYRDERDIINTVYKRLKQDQAQADITHIIRELHGIVDEAIDTRSVRDGDDQSRLYDISKIDFDRLKREFEASPKKQTTVQSLKNAIDQRLHKLMMQNPLRTDFREHYEKLVDEYNQEKNRVVIEKTFEALIKLVSDLNREETRAVREGLNEETLALFDLLKKPDLSKKELGAIKKVARDLLATLKNKRLNVANWQEKESTRDAVRQQIYDFLYDENTGLPVDSYEVEDIGHLTDDVYQHVVRVYPVLPSPVYSAGVH
ncbi:type I restriction endonuclease subunit R [Endozoicomonas gorgoniicola]|uniref:Type I restriction enzyme endonuclease subunit n=1 Tax=Endozoicomonas gorgoniicola TaxID=1234144 RepID=A0ABT3N237_9GAMM|nr:type I restriction endonuclease subunit R [Endozoicomonas gorgoniicola]MCW7555694.1 type I restriction endonuclease subunit R [Endozoicomonas gorgoniicola]